MKNKLPKYENYKPSNVEWLGEIPQHWEVTSVKHLLSIPITDGPHTTPELLEEGVPFISAEAIKNGKIDFSKKRGFISKKEHKLFSKKYSPQKGDIYMVKSGATTGNVAMVNTDDDFSIWSPLAVFRANNKKIHANYLHFILQSTYFKNGVELNWSFGTQQNIGMGILSNLPIAYGNISEQEKIAKFLDEKTTKLDKAIEIKQRQIELLKERRQILIHRAVTRGVGSLSGVETPLKDSGVEWIGKIPEHWEVKRLKDNFTLGKGLTITKENLKDEGILCVNYGEIHSKYGVELKPEIHKLKCVDAEYLKNNANSLLNNGDFVFADTSEDIGGSGNFTFLNSDLPVFAGYHTIIARPNKSIYSKFLSYEFDSLIFRSQIKSKVKGVKVYSITQSILKELVIWVPPFEEQIAIAEHLENISAKISKAIGLKEREIEVLKEYKSSLINSAVTGKVKIG